MHRGLIRGLDVERWWVAVGLRCYVYEDRTYGTNIRVVIFDVVREIEEGRETYEVTP